MKIEHSQISARSLSVRLAATSALLAASVFANAVLATDLVFFQQQILVPTLPGPVALSPTGAVNEDYLESMARDATYLFLNRTPDSEDQFNSALLKIADPQTYKAIRAALIDQKHKMPFAHASQTFFPVDWYYDPTKLYVEVAGKLVVTSGSSTVESSNYYAMRFRKLGASLRLLSFEQIDHDHAVGPKVPITRPKPVTEGGGQP